MAGNSSNEQIKNVAFSELNLMIDQWTSEMQENQNVFSLQCEELNKLTFGICNCRDKLKTLYDRLILAKCFQDNIDQNIIYIFNRQKDIEQMVIKLENDTEIPCKCNVSRDVYRENTYNVAEKINSTYLNFMEAVEELQICTGQIKQEYGDVSNIEQIAQLLQNQLQQLENIEIKIQDMKNRLNQTEYYKQHVLTSLHIKENIL